MLVVVEHRDVQPLLQPLLDLKAARRRDVLQVDPAERRRDQLHHTHDLACVGRVQADRKRIHACELLEQAALALHHRHRRARADVAKPEHRAAVRDDRHRVALDRVLEGLLVIVGNGQAHARHPRRIGHRKIVPGLQRVLVVLFDLAAHVQQEGAVCRVDHLGVLQRLDGGRYPAPVLAARGIHDDVTHAVLAVDLHQVDGADDAACLGDRGGDEAEHAGRVVQPDPDR